MAASPEAVLMRHHAHAHAPPPPPSLTRPPRATPLPPGFRAGIVADVRAAEPLQTTSSGLAAHLLLAGRSTPCWVPIQVGSRLCIGGELCLVPNPSANCTPWPARLFHALSAAAADDEQARGSRSSGLRVSLQGGPTVLARLFGSMPEQQAIVDADRSQILPCALRPHSCMAVACRAGLCVSLPHLFEAPLTVTQPDPS